MCMDVYVCVCVCSCLFELFQRLLRPKDKLQWDIFTVTVWSTAGAQNMLCYFEQCGRADDPRVTQGRNDLILQQPADLRERHTHTHRKRKKARKAHHCYVCPAAVRRSELISSEE